MMGSCSAGWKEAEVHVSEGERVVFKQFRGIPDASRELPSEVIVLSCQTEISASVETDSLEGM